MWILGKVEIFKRSLFPALFEALFGSRMKSLNVFFLLLLDIGLEVRRS